ncbi:MAG: SIR2 family protein [Selenomonadales bacterium]|nr:SIR2 family protein [Selenomonadales bacterium]
MNNDTEKERIKKNVKAILSRANICFLLGAGASVKIEPEKKNFPLMEDLMGAVKANKEVIGFWESITEKGKDVSTQYGMVKNLLDRYLMPEKANVEQFLSLLDSVEQFIVDEDFRKKTACCCEQVKASIKQRIQESDTENILPIYKKFYQAIRHLKEMSGNTSKATSVFTTNYDMLNEQAMEDLGIHYYAGFYGIVNRRFNLAYYDHEYVNTHKIKNASYIVDNDHINLFKLHGSLSWFYDEKKNELVEKNPYAEDFSPEIIYPSSMKFQKTNAIVYYSSLMREFSDKICQEDTALIVIGTSLSDEHINKLIENALSISRFTLIIFGFDANQIRDFEHKYDKHNNVLIYPEGKTFEELADFLLEIEGDSHE